MIVCFIVFCSDVLLIKIDAIDPEPFQASSLSGLNARHLESLMKLACLTEDVPAAFTNLYSNRVKARLQTAKQTEVENARETNALMRKLDEDIARVLEQEQSSFTGVDHNADKKTVKAPLVQLETFDLDGTEDTASSTSSNASPRFPDLAGADVNLPSAGNSSCTSLDAAIKMAQHNAKKTDFSVSSQECLMEPEREDTLPVVEETEEEEEALSDFQVRFHLHVKISKIKCYHL